MGIIDVGGGSMALPRKPFRPLCPDGVSGRLNWPAREHVWSYRLYPFSGYIHLQSSKRTLRSNDLNIQSCGGHGRYQSRHIVYNTGTRYILYTTHCFVSSIHIISNARRIVYK